MTKKAQKGFTLLELLIAMFTGTIVILAAGTILFFGQKSWNNVWSKANLQRDASYAMMRMSRLIRSGALGQVESNGEGLRIYSGGSWKRFFVVPATSTLALKYEFAENQYQTILDDNVESVQFNVTGNTVGIDLKLKKEDYETNFVSTIMMRNYGQ